MDKKRLEVLLQLYLDEGLDAEAKQELEKLLLSSPEAREIFWERTNLNSMLRQLGQESWGHDGATVERASTLTNLTGTHSHWRSWLIAMSFLFAVGLAWWTLNANRQIEEQGIAQKNAKTENVPSEEIAQDDTDESEPRAWVALVRKTVEAEWVKGDEPLKIGEAMGARVVRLEGGLVEMQTSRGVLLTLQGPAELEIISEMEVLCVSGRLRVDVPPSAIGFLVNTPHIDVVDLGTSFAVDVNSNHETEVHVIEGKVELVSDSKAMPVREIVQGQAVGVTRDAFREIDSGTALMPTASQVNSKARIANGRLREAWKRRRDAILNDPSCFTYFDFESGSKQGLTLFNMARNAKPSSNGTIVGCEWVEGRWPGKRALDFKTSFDRVLFEAPGEYERLTCLASVRLDSINSSVLPLLMPASSLDGAFRWQMNPSMTAKSSARIQFGRRGKNGWDVTNQYFGTPSFHRGHLRTWVQLAVVWDGVDGLCSQYVNGVLVSRDKVQLSSDSEPMMLRSKNLQIGNSTFDNLNLSKQLSHFTGRVDELAMFNRALSKQEITTYHDLKKITWSNAMKNGDWNDPDNWPARIQPSISDAIYIDVSGNDAAIYADGISPNLNEIRVGSMDGLRGELRIAGGTLTASRNSNANSRIGVAGGDGTVIQGGGSVELNTLQLGLDEASRGVYRLKGGRLLLKRGIDKNTGSLDIGAFGGVGTFEVTGGSLETRIGVTLGRGDGVGELTVSGSTAEKISIGSHGSGSGFWVQHAGSTFRALVDDQGLTPILIRQGSEKAASIEPCTVAFKPNALLEVDFINEPKDGVWDIMKWEGELIENGLTFSPKVDTDIWKFDFVDTDSSGTPDTLRVTASITEPVSQSISND